MSAPLAPKLAEVDPEQAWRPWKPDQAQPWDAAWAAHLYRRAAFGASPAVIERAVKDGYPATLDRLLRGSPGFEEFDALFADSGKGANLPCWWLVRMLYGGFPLREKLALFWHNHFATSTAKVPSEQMLRQNELFRRHALSSFRTLLLEVSRDPAMLIWLDSNRNVKAHPNENFAREVMELFSLGVGNYSEEDVREAARAFTGWHTNSKQTEFAFNTDQHDQGVKSILGRTGNCDGMDVIRFLLEDPATARLLAGKLYRDFVSEVEPPAALLEPLADRFRGADYDIADLVRCMLSSRLFFSEHAYLKRISSPVEFALRTVQSAWSGPIAPSNIATHLTAMGQTLFAPPNVKGWPSGRAWLNDATMLARNNFAEWATIQAGADDADQAKLEFSVVLLYMSRFPFIERAPRNSRDRFDVSFHARRRNAHSPKEAVAALTEQFFPGGLNAVTTARLQAFIADGAPAKRDLALRIRETAHAMMCMPEYQLC
jgi:hypothetical protein